MWHTKLSSRPAYGPIIRIILISPYVYLHLFLLGLVHRRTQFFFFWVGLGGWFFFLRLISIIHLMRSREGKKKRILSRLGNFWPYLRKFWPHRHRPSFSPPPSPARTHAHSAQLYTRSRWEGQGPGSGCRINFFSPHSIVITLLDLDLRLTVQYNRSLDYSILIFFFFFFFFFSLSFFPILTCNSVKLRRTISQVVGEATTDDAKAVR